MKLAERFKKFMANIRDNAQMVGADTKIAKEFKDIFEVGGVPSFNEFYNFGILPWKMLYRGFYSAWHLIKAPTIANPEAERRMSYLNLSKAVCQELAGCSSGAHVLAAAVVSLPGNFRQVHRPP